MEMGEGEIRQVILVLMDAIGTTPITALPDSQRDPLMEPPG
jgi:hypothetical protein